MASRWLGYTSLVVAAVLLFAVNIFGGRILPDTRIDLTENKIYTLSQGTLNILSKLDEPITLRFYLSQSLATQLPSVGSYAERVKELLGEFERAAGGKLNVHRVDPEPFSEDEDRAVGYGLKGLPLNEGDETLYFGLVGTNSTDDEENIPFFTPSREQFLEYDITKLIHNLANPEQPMVGIIDGLRIRGGVSPQMGMPNSQAPPWAIATHIEQTFDLRDVSKAVDGIPDDIDMLMITHPKNLGDRLLYAIDQFVMRGGRLLVFADPHADSEQVMAMGAPPTGAGLRGSSLNRLLEVWGLTMETEYTVGDMTYAATVSMDQQGRTVSFRYPVWLNILPESINQSDPVTAQLGNVSFGTPGSLRQTEGATTTFTPLISTTAEAGKFSLDAVSMGANPQDLVRSYKPGGEAFVLAARVTGKVKSAFPDGPPPGEDEAGAAPKPAASAGMPAPAEHLTESKGPVNLIVVADADMLHDRFWVQIQDFLGSQIAVPSAANGDFVINAIDNLAGSGDLISVRNRGTFIRPFVRIQALQQQAEVAFREKEEELVQRLSETEAKLGALQQGDQASGGEFTLSEAQKEELIKFRQERLRVRKDLRDVRLELRRSIESMQQWLKFINIGLVPLLIGGFGIVIGLIKLRRRRAPRPEATAAAV